MILDAGNILNFNVGAAVDLSVPRSFWSRLSGKYGNMFYWQEKVGDTHMTTVLITTSCLLKQYRKRTLKLLNKSLKIVFIRMLLIVSLVTMWD